MTSNAAPTSHHRRVAVAERAAFGDDPCAVRRDAAPVLCAEILVRHCLFDDAILSHLAYTWPLDPSECEAALDAAHILLRREVPHGSYSAGL